MSARADRRQRCRGCRRLQARVDELAKQNEALKTEKAALQAKLEVARREGKRQAAPFSRNRRMPEKKRKRPGRKAGADHGRHGHRVEPVAVDDEIVVPLPDACPHCGCRELSVHEVSRQFQDELVTAVVRRRFLIERGRCPDCARMVRGRHPAQTSDALGAAGTMLGPRAMALAAWLHYGCGVSAQKVAASSASSASRSAPRGSPKRSSAWPRTPRAPTTLSSKPCGPRRWSPPTRPRGASTPSGGGCGCSSATRSPSTRSPSETVPGATRWRARSWGRSSPASSAGTVGPPTATSPKPPTRPALHLIRRSNELIADAVGGQARIPHALRRLLLDALALRDARDAGKVAGRRLKAEIKKLEERADTLLRARVTHEPNRRLLAHVRTERQALFTFLTHPGVPATNHEAERAIRPQVVTRKQWGGNKSLGGARASVMLGSVLRTSTQQDANPIDVLVDIATSDGRKHGLDLPTGPAP